MSQIADRVSSRTTLAWGQLSGPVALYKTTSSKPEGGPTFVKAGPNGEPLERGPVKDGKRLEGGVPVPAPEAAERPVDVEAGDPLSMSPLDPPERPEAEAEPGHREEVTVGLLEDGYDKELTEEDVREGVRAMDGTFIDLTDQLAAIRAETQLEEMRIVGFVRREQVPRSRILGSYYLGGDGPGAPKVVRLLMEAMRATQRVAIVRWTKTSRQATGAIVPGRHAGAPIVLELEWAANFRQPGPRALTHLEAEVSEVEVAAAVELAEAMKDSGVLIDEMQDDRVRLERKLVDTALSGADVGIFAVPSRPEPVEGSVEDALRESLDLVA